MSDEFRVQSEKLEAFEALSKRIFNDVFKFHAALIEMDFDEDDFSTLTTHEIMDKIRAIMKSDCCDVNKLIFLHYLAKYPVSMCKRDVSPLLKQLIGFHYRLGVPDEHLKGEGAEKVSYEDLAEIFGRSKATISECVNATEAEWQNIQRQAEQEREAEEEAKRQLIADKKKELAEQEEKNTNNQTSERTLTIPPEEDNTSQTL